MRILLVTNDFPPRVGGIENYLRTLYGILAERGIEITVLCPDDPRADAYDRTAPMEVERWPGAVYWPRPALARRITELSRRADTVVFGAVLPVALLAERLDVPAAVHAHGFEVAWTKLPGARQALGRIARAARPLMMVSDFCLDAVRDALGDGSRLEILRGGVDLDRFRPGLDGSAIRERHALGDRPVVACISRLIPRKGQDQIIRALPLVRREIPAVALLVGDGPARSRLQALAEREGVAGSVVFAGVVPHAHEELPHYYAAGDVFAMPCRTRWGGLEPEALGLVYLEAQACARPAITGDSGGAPEAVVPGETGATVPGRDHRALAHALTEILGDPARARRMGQAGREMVERRHRWDDVATRFLSLLEAARA